jgi:hypothetical protein
VSDRPTAPTNQHSTSTSTPPPRGKEYLRATNSSLRRIISLSRKTLHDTGVIPTRASARFSVEKDKKPWRPFPIITATPEPLPIIKWWRLLQKDRPWRPLSIITATPEPLSKWPYGASLPQSGSEISQEGRPLHFAPHTRPRDASLLRPQPRFPRAFPFFFHEVKML